MSDFYVSVRMRASREGIHRGGAERLVRNTEWSDALRQVSARARSYGDATEVAVTSELVPVSAIHRCQPLPVRTVPAGTVAEARAAASALLMQCGVSTGAVAVAMELLDRGPGPNNSVMRGGVLMDAATGQRLEPDPARGVRASHLDYTAECWRETSGALAAEGLTNRRTIEALAIATKACWSGGRAELCWSDDPTYVAGYVAGGRIGYCRFNQIKEAGAPIGGRVFFLASPSETAGFIARLERSALLIDNEAIS